MSDNKSVNANVPEYVESVYHCKFCDTPVTLQQPIEGEYSSLCDRNGRRHACIGLSILQIAEHANGNKLSKDAHGVNLIRQELAIVEPIKATIDFLNAHLQSFQLELVVSEKRSGAI